MRLSVSLRTMYSARRARDAAGWLVARTRAARAAGLDALFVGDHHGTGPAAYFQNVPTLGRLLAEWGPQPFGALFLLPMWNPVLVAEQIGTLATLGEGRFVMQTAIGDGAAQFASMGASLRGRASYFETELDAVRRLLAGEVVDIPELGVVEAHIAPIPAEPVEIWIGATAAVGIERAARLGDAWICNAPMIPSEAREQADAYRNACARQGRTPTAVAIRREVHVAASADAGAEAIERAVAAGYRGFRGAALTAGTVEQVAEQFLELGAMGYTDVVVRHFHDDPDEVLASIARLGQVRALIA